jgi:hypothetical protein
MTAARTLLKQLLDINRLAFTPIEQDAYDRALNDVVRALYPVDAIARVCHEANAVYCCHTPEAWVRKPERWENLDDHTRESAISGVIDVILDRTSTPEEAHNRWMGFKVKDGWTPGTTFDLGAKIHPCMRPYAELHEAHRRKDVLFRAIVGAFLVPA